MKKEFWIRRTTEVKSMTSSSLDRSVKVKGFLYFNLKALPAIQFIENLSCLKQKNIKNLITFVTTIVEEIVG